MSKELTKQSALKILKRYNNFVDAVIQHDEDNTSIDSKVNLGYRMIPTLFRLAFVGLLNNEVDSKVEIIENISDLFGQDSPVTRNFQANSDYMISRKILTEAISDNESLSEDEAKIFIENSKNVMRISKSLRAEALQEHQYNL